ncbi:MAG: heme A synthase [Betaproteobacteria bacterium]|jgi:cytochrome c oxidase assembly protein subunit 15|nr:heme A synthase [Betaproteobacteria bacterium]NBS38152.1 heme A synthase [Betaproteobacteria bacterium]NBT70304.1 heme A synthase [Betaproteobacteria bacterium]NDE44836.1 heme A synthase [Betaproteobacteria bacterium]NDG80742.1 heme A synthase [Betaproteobacteria bacterium]
MSTTLPRYQAQVIEPGSALIAYRRLIGWSALICFALIMIGAWVRLTDAGLGCPDWPGCYGKLTPVQAKDQIAQAVAEQGGDHGPVSMGKAWREMVHRYIATGLGLLIIGIVVLAWRFRHRLQQSPWLASVTLAVVILQGMFGKWTVTLLLKPAIVTGHLIGGLLTFSLLFWLWLRTRQAIEALGEGLGSAADARSATQRAQAHAPGHQPAHAPSAKAAHAPGHQAAHAPSPGLQWLARLGLCMVAFQIALGGWTSTNYAALACPDFPTCQEQWIPRLNFGDAFHVVRELGKTAQGDMIDLPALTAIHLSHRIGAVLVLLSLSLLIFTCFRRQVATGEARWLLLMLVLQWALGISNVIFDLPLWVAVAHTGGAVVLLALTLLINFRLQALSRVGQGG